MIGAAAFSEREINLNRAFRVVTATASFLAVASEAPAETVSRTVGKWGLVGSWAHDCSVPPGRNNAWLTYKINTNGRVVHLRDFGDMTDENQVVSAELSDDGALNLRVVFSRLKQTRDYNFVKVADDAIRTTYNHVDGSNDYTVKDGKFVANGNPTPEMKRCK